MTSIIQIFLDCLKLLSCLRLLKISCHPGGHVCWTGLSASALPRTPKQTGLYYSADNMQTKDVRL